MLRQKTLMIDIFYFTHAVSKAVSLTDSHTMTPFDGSGEEAFRKHYGKRRKLLVQAISPFPTMFSTLSKTELRSDCTYVQADLALHSPLHYKRTLALYHTIPTFNDPVKESL